MDALQRIHIRKASMEDLPGIMTLFKETVSVIGSAYYDQQQIDAWISAGDNIQKWKDKLTNQYFMVAENGQKIVGFASLEKGDHLDYLYVHKDFQRKGIGMKLIKELEREAARNGKTSLRADVSKSALSFFLKNKFKLLSQNVIKINDVEIVNYKMMRKNIF